MLDIIVYLLDMMFYQEWKAALQLMDQLPLQHLEADVITYNAPWTVRKIEV